MVDLQKASFSVLPSDASHMHANVRQLNVTPLQTAPVELAVRKAVDERMKLAIWCIIRRVWRRAVRCGNRQESRRRVGDPPSDQPSNMV